MTESLGIWGFVICRWKGLENTFPTVYCTPHNIWNCNHKTKQKKNYGRLATIDHAGQKNYNWFPQWLFWTQFSTSVNTIFYLGRLDLNRFSPNMKTHVEFYSMERPPTPPPTILRAGVEGSGRRLPFGLQSCIARLLGRWSNKKATYMQQGFWYMRYLLGEKSWSWTSSWWRGFHSFVVGTK